MKILQQFFAVFAFHCRTAHAVPRPLCHAKNEEKCGADKAAGQHVKIAYRA